MSTACASAHGSQMNPFTARPSASSRVPIPSGAGMPATNEPEGHHGACPTAPRRSARPPPRAPGPARAGRFRQAHRAGRRSTSSHARRGRRAGRQLPVPGHPGEMRAHHREPDVAGLGLPALAGLRLRHRRGTQRPARRPPRPHDVPLPALAQLAQGQIAPRGRDERDPERQPIAADAGGHGEGRQSSRFTKLCRCQGGC